jgi:hypothetical protein
MGTDFEKGERDIRSQDERKRTVPVRAPPRSARHRWAARAGCGQAWKGLQFLTLCPVMVVFFSFMSTTVVSHASAPARSGSMREDALWSRGPEFARDVAFRRGWSDGFDQRRSCRCPFLRASAKSSGLAAIAGFAQALSSAGSNPSERKGWLGNERNCCRPGRRAAGRNPNHA